MKQKLLLLIGILCLGFSSYAQYNHFMYFTDRDVMATRYFNIQDPMSITNFDFTNLDKPYGIVVDSVNNHVFVSDATSGKIIRYNLEGTTEEVILDVLIEPLVDYPYGLALYDGKLYWGREGGIGRCNLDGSDPELFQNWLQQGPPEMAIGLAYNPDDNRLYFTNDKYDYSGGVFRINMDGTGLEEIVSGTDGVAIAVDWEHDKIYYCDYLQGVCMSDYDGSNETVIDPDYVDAVIWGLVVDMYAGKIYYTDKYDDKILQANLDGTGRVDFVTGVDAYALAWFSEDVTGVSVPGTFVEPGIFPNPAKDMIVFENIAAYREIVVMNSLGQSVRNVQTGGEASLTMNLEGLEQGMYFVRLIKGDDVLVKKLVIE